MNTYKHFIKNELKIISISIFLGLILVILITGLKCYFGNMQQSIANEVIRLHVLANSDSKKDQNLKIEVKNAVINMLETELKESSSKEETENIILQNLDKIKQKALEVINKNGYNYDVSVSLKDSYFPTKKYGNVTLPKGNYEALKIEIGEAKGQNWWCVMFPPLCFVDLAVKEISKEDLTLLQNILSDEEFDLITKKDENIVVKFKFKLLELFN